MRVLENCKPENVFRYFEDISRIPRGPGNEKAVSDYILNFALDLGLDAVQDKALNLIIKKPGTKGYEHSDALIIQGHMDMVCEKNKDIKHDFLTDPLKLYIDGDFVRAEGTTLGGDNGVALAYAMALLAADDIKHPPLEIVLTTDEETGMSGAMAIEPEMLNAGILINIDSEEEGVFLSSCAGGIKVTLSLKGALHSPPGGFMLYTIAVSGLKGGHSGMDIVKERGNSNRIMGRILNEVSKKIDIYLQSVSGGSKDNAIPREAEAAVWIDEDKIQDFTVLMKETEVKLTREYRAVDEGIKISVASSENTGEAFEKEMTEKIIAALLLIPNGIQNMSTEINGLVETSNNLGVVSTIGDEITLTCALRSSVISRKYALLEQIEILARLLGGKIGTKGNYPAWEYNSDSKIRKIFLDTYRDMYGKEAEVTAVHAGLECGIFAEKIKNIDMISFGPDIFDVHTPEERMSISSVARTWKFLLEILLRMK